MLNSKKIAFLLMILILFNVFIVGNLRIDAGEEPDIKLKEILNEKELKIIEKYKDKNPEEWGERVPGVFYKINTDKKIVALTLDACGSENDGYDKKLMNFLIKENIPATLFINYRWIDKNKDIFMELADNPLFSIQNHGYRHLPLSINGKSVYNIKGTNNVEEVMEEVLYNEEKIKKLIGKEAKYFRTGTAYYDEVAVQIVNELGKKVIAYNVLGDAGATYSKKEVKEAFLSVNPGDIILAHMNHPESETAEGIMDAIPELKEKGYQFIRLEDYEHKLISK